MKKTIGNLLGSRIASIRKKRDLNQAELAELVNTANETISRIERGFSIPSVKTLEKFSQALQVPIKEFFTFDTAHLDCVPIRKNELTKVVVLLQNKSRADIKLSHQILKTLFEQLKHRSAPFKKDKSTHSCNKSLQ